MAKALQRAEKELLNRTVMRRSDYEFGTVTDLVLVDELLKCVIIDRLEARLRKLDTMIAGARVRRLEGNEWAEQILATFPELRAPRSPHS
jgi:hypothetical protein